MKIFVDINVFVDVQTKRDGWAPSFELLHLVSLGIHYGYISSLTPPIIYFLIKRLAAEEDAVDEMLDLIQDFKVVDLTEKTIKDAAKDKRTKDFEYTIQFQCARNVAKVLITRNVDDFQKVGKDIEIIKPEEFLKKHRR